MAWVLLAYRLPRDPSTPRSALWRKLRRLGAVQVLDGLAALPLERRAHSSSRARTASERVGFRNCVGVGGFGRRSDRFGWIVWRLLVAGGAAMTGLWAW